MIQQTDAKHLTCLTDSLCDFFIAYTGGRISSRMIVNQYQVDRMITQSFQKDFSRSDQRCIDGSLRQQRITKQMVLLIQHHADHHFLLLMTELLHIIRSNRIRIFKIQHSLAASLAIRFDSSPIHFS